ncbi:thiamine pyrophosphate-dependent enzyme [Thalassobacillus hwangdonensis]|uniref:Thiamine pyrophosphate-dependent enzyme n=1 Tax=Thalassobacillus hwangdonensis TaxID=546108 RepID=A0ABW3L1X4_9BACI
MDQKMIVSDKTTLMTGARGIVECLKLEGVSKVFCVPGESYLPVMDAIHDEETITLMSARHESGAAFMAEGYAKATGKPGIVMATRGVGAANLSIGVHTAYQDSTPMVVFLGQVHSKFRGREGFQEVDLDRFFDPIAKWSVEISHADRVPELVQRALRIAQSGRPGPVIISLPEDMLKQVASMQFGLPMRKYCPVPSSRDMEEIKKVLQQADRPVVIAGGGIKSSKAEDALQHFAEKYSIPVAASFRRHDVLPNDHAAYAGHLGLGTDPLILNTVKEADVVLAIGSRLSEVTTQDYSLISPTQKLIHIDIAAETIGNVFNPAVGVVADAREALEALNRMEFTKDWGSWMLERRKVYEGASALEVEAAAAPLSNKQVMASLQRLLPSDAILTNDAGNFASWMHTFYQFTGDQAYIGPTSGAMGYGMPAALGAKIAFPDRPVISLSGDGGFMMTVQEIETAVRYRIPIISIVFNNQMYGTIRMHQEMHFPEKVIGTELGQVRFDQMAKSMGADGYLVQTIDEFDDVLAQALKHAKPTVIEVPMDPDQISVKRTIQDFRNNAVNT